MPRFRTLGREDVETKKSAIDVVTEADTLAEIQITKALQALYPGALVFGEEAHARDTCLTSGLDEVELAFIIDPVDGTLNFVKGLPLFGTLLSVIRYGEPIGGMIYDPVNRAFLMASRGGGARQVSATGHETRLRVAAPAPLKDMSGSMCLMFFPEPHKTRIANQLGRIGPFHGVNCSVYDYWLVATGGAHFCFNLCGQIWDHLAGTLIHSEAGGFNAHFDGSPYNALGEPANVLAAPDQESWELIRREVVGLSA
ncbi:MAG: inositol monophosphatase [Ponticaulis sp.]|nr:inositol monophosphatase [Ponticaulis sp.]